MSYSRWGSRGSGYWYTYWCVQPSGKKETKDNALFEICDVCVFTAKQLRNNMKECIDNVAIKDRTVKKELLQELKIYMNEFLYDVEKKYS